MLMLHNGKVDYNKNVQDLSAKTLSSSISWIDLLEGTPEEIAFVERVTDRHMPTLSELKEIESSSRLRYTKNAFCLSAPVVSRTTTGMPQMTPVGFILTRELLITVRFEPLTAFSVFEADYAGSADVRLRGVDAFVGLINAIVDRAADVLEVAESELDEISQNVFYEKSGVVPRPRRPAREARSLREIVRQIGHYGDLSSKIRDSLLGVGRIVSYVSDIGGDWFLDGLRAHLDAQHHDIASLADYDVHLTNKVQLLLDATMGLINIEQNEIIKVLTIVSVVGVPPTLVASMYGMNFHNMPELSWAWGYPFGLGLIFLSAVGPLVWFKVRGWL